MFFDRLLKKRRQAPIKVLSPEILAETALSHEDPAVRLDAVRQLASLSHLHAVLCADGDARVREIASARYRNLLCGTEEAELALEDRLSAIADLDDMRMAEHLATDGREPEIRRAAIERVVTPEVLVNCVLRDPLAANRGAALERIADRSSLEQVVRRIGKKDKGVYRQARERLRQIAALDEVPRRVRAQCAELCERAEHLGHLESWTQDRGVLEHLDRQWAQIQDQAEPQWRARYQAARERFLSAYGAYREANAAAIAAQEAQAALLSVREGLIVELEQARSLGNEEALEAERTRLIGEWEALEALPDGQRGVGARFTRALEALDAAIKTMSDQRKDTQRLKRCVANAEKLLVESKPLDRVQARKLIKQGKSLSQTLTGVIPADAFTSLVERIEARLETQKRHAEKRLEGLPERLDELENALEGGELKRADPLHQSVQASMDLIRASGLSGSLVDEIASRLRTLAPRLRDLQHWRRWGADQHREALCDAMETLREQDMPLPAVAERLHVLQADWKELDQSGARANQALWTRFHAAAELVHTRCRPVLEAEAAEQEANRAARQATCEELESFLAQVDWDRIDWKRVMRAERETRQAWAAIGHCEPRQRRPLDRRFHKAIKALDRRLEAERAQNQAFKRDLVDQVRALAEEPNLEAAIERTKSLQREWHTTVPARQRDENRLWSEFRSACDVVFERRAAIHQAQRTELDENLMARQAICDEALALADTHTNSRQLMTAQRELEQRWIDAESLPIPRQASGALARRWQDACERVQAHEKNLRATERRDALDLLARQAALCQRLEQLVMEGNESVSTQDLEDAWSQLPELEDQALQAAMTARFHAALDSLGDPERQEALRAQLGPNAERQHKLCLEMEIAAGADSPPEFAQARLELQVSRLSGRMSEGGTDGLRTVEELLGDWYRCGPAPSDLALDARLERIRELLGSAPGQA